MSRSSAWHWDGPRHSTHSALRLGTGVEGNELPFVPQRRAFANSSMLAQDREIGGIDAVQLLRVRMNMDQRSPGIGEGRDRVAVGGGLAQPGANCHNKICGFDALDQLRVGAIAEIARIGAACRAERVLTSEGGRDGQAQPFGEELEMRPCLRIPACTADDRDGRGRIAQHRE